MKYFTVVVGPSYYTDQVVVEWQEPIGVGDFANHLELGLSQLHGVEYAKVKKYSADLWIASHVTGQAALMPLIGAYFNSPQVNEELARMLKVPEVHVDVVAGVPRLGR